MMQSFLDRNSLFTRPRNETLPDILFELSDHLTFFLYLI